MIYTCLLCSVVLFSQVPTPEHREQQTQPPLLAEITHDRAIVIATTTLQRPPSREDLTKYPFAEVHRTAASFDVRIHSVNH